MSRTVYSAAFARFGARSVIVAPRSLRNLDRISIGEDVVVFTGAWLDAEPGHSGPLSIGDGTYLGNNCHLHAVSDVTIGRGCVFADNVFVSSSEHGRTDRHEIRDAGTVTIGDHVFLGQNVCVLGGVTIGDGATVGAGAVVTRDVAPGEVVGGVPARPLRSTPR
ncbi:acyltransferase [Brachybacterium sillae]|uniref:acyltransferase n=1 Tax=Brachybacterium sillae TaxID=2810536 RepID=UPI003D81938B